MSRWLFLSLIVILTDQATKQFAEAMLIPYQAVTVLPFFDLTLMYNKGAAFSFLSDQGGWQRWFFVMIALLVTAVLIGWLRRLKAQEKWVAISLSLIIGGAIGNVIDRILFGQVIDFVDMYYTAESCLPGFARLANECHWPAFNVADSAIFVGVAIMLIDAFFLSSPTHPPRRVRLGFTAAVVDQRVVSSALGGQLGVLFGVSFPVLLLPLSLSSERFRRCSACCVAAVAAVLFVQRVFFFTFCQ